MKFGFLALIGLSSQIKINKKKLSLYETYDNDTAADYATYPESYYDGTYGNYSNYTEYAPPPYYYPEPYGSNFTYPPEPCCYGFDCVCTEPYGSNYTNPPYHGVAPDGTFVYPEYEPYFDGNETYGNFSNYPPSYYDGVLPDGSYNYTDYPPPEYYGTLPPDYNEWNHTDYPPPDYDDTLPPSYDTALKADGTPYY